ncbi:hypothetical protein ACP70R_004260 [Stipagrostis hirtigluma subsp. patula]
MVDPLEVICSVVAGEIFQKIVSPIIGNYNSQKHLEEKLQQLRQLLITIHAALEAAEGQSITNSWLLRWIRKLEDAACEGGRVLRDWGNSTYEEVSMHDRVVGRIKERQHAIDFLLRPPVDQIYSTYIRKFDHRGRTVSMIPYGYVLTIWGRKGVGKTKLAQLICKNQIVRNHFSMVIWVCCREHPSPELAIVRLFCEKLEFTDYNGKCISNLVRRIAVRLRKERFLLVLDGVSSYSSEMDEILIVLLGNSRSGSKVIITTIYEQLASRMGNHNVLSVGFLPMEDLGCLFMENALGGEHPEEYRKLPVIGKEIAETLRECSPLAAKVVSGLLRDNLKEKYWYSVLSSCRQLHAPRPKVTPFMLGCKLLPDHLQSCFGLFGTYPRWTFTRDNLVSLWVHNGVISDKGRKKG